MVVPEGFDDPARPSGGNIYDQRVAAGLAHLGWDVRVLPVTGSWPETNDRSSAGLSALLSRIADREIVLIDGLIASPSAGILRPHLRRLSVVVLLHMPLAPGCPVASASERAVVTGARSVVVTSCWTRDHVIGVHGVRADHVRVARPGVDVPAVTRVRPDGRSGSRLLHIGPLAEHKGGDVLVSALGRLGRLDWHCAWVGDLRSGEPFAQRVLADVSAMPHRHHLRGVLPHRELESCWAATDLLIAPSRRETYGMAVTEALAHGIPVIASDAGGLPEAVGTDRAGRRPGRVVPAGDVDALTGALREWLTSPSLRGVWRSAADDRRSTLTGWEEPARVVAMALRSADSGGDA